MKIFNTRNILIFLLLLLVIIIYLWPKYARNNCVNLVQQRIDAPGEITANVANNVYRKCVATHGLKPEDLFNQ